MKSKFIKNVKNTFKGLPLVIQLLMSILLTISIVCLIAAIVAFPYIIIVYIIIIYMYEKTDS